MRVMPKDLVLDSSNFPRTLKDGEGTLSEMPPVPVSVSGKATVGGRGVGTRKT